MKYRVLICFDVAAIRKCTYFVYVVCRYVLITSMGVGGRAHIAMLIDPRVRVHRSFYESIITGGITSSQRNGIIFEKKSNTTSRRRPPNPPTRSSSQYGNLCTGRARITALTRSVS